MINIKERFLPIQINQHLCLRCERCLRACNRKAIYFKSSIRLVDYSKCVSCLNCIQVCSRNAIEVTSVVNEQILTVKIDSDKCNLCLNCVNQEDSFCPNDLFHLEIKDANNKENRKIQFKFREIDKCQGCEVCKSACPEEAIEPIKFEA